MRSRVSVDGVEFVGVGLEHPFRSWYRFLSQERPDWWYWRCSDHWLGPAFQMAKVLGVRTIFAAALDDVCPRHALSRHPRLWPLYAWGLSKADRIFVQHSSQLSEIALRWRPKTHIVSSIASTSQVAVRPHATRAKYVAWVGTLKRPKRPDLLIEIARSAPTIMFVVCGGPTSFMSPPGYSDQVISGLQGLKNVQYLGRVEPPKANQVIADASVLLSTSDEEGFPNTFLQAWSAGTPVVSMKVDPDGVIQRLKLGAVAPTAEKAVTEIEYLLASIQGRDEIAHRAKKHVMTAHGEAFAIRAFEHALRNTRQHLADSAYSGTQV